MRASFILVFIGVLLLFSGNAFGRSGSCSSDTVSAWRIIHKGGFVIDVRTADGYSLGHLKGAKNISFNEIEERRNELPSDTRKAIVVYGHLGKRADIAKKKLQAMGYSHVVNGGGYEKMIECEPLRD